MAKGDRAAELEAMKRGMLQRARVETPGAQAGSERQPSRDVLSIEVGVHSAASPCDGFSDTHPRPRGTTSIVRQLVEAPREALNQNCWAIAASVWSTARFHRLGEAILPYPPRLLMCSTAATRWKPALGKVLAILALAAPLLSFVDLRTLQSSPMSASSSSSSPTEVATSLLAREGFQLKSLRVLQSLWAGYGYICQVTASPDSSPMSSGKTSRAASATSSSASTPQETQSFILKLIAPPPTKVEDEGHTRKILSYQVEQHFYAHLAPQLPSELPVAKCLASINQSQPNGTLTAMILSDLRQEFPVAGEKRNVLNSIQVGAALDWLSGFHGFWWPRVKDMDRRGLVRPPLDEVRRDGHDGVTKSVWLNGGYTYLATRRKEYASLASDYSSEWNEPLTDWEQDSRSVADMVAAVLAPKEAGWSPIEEYQTLIHGDVKSENLFTSVSGERVAFYDFQYVGLGLGVCDLAKLFTCSVPLDMLVHGEDMPRELGMGEGEERLLKRYWQRLTQTGGKDYHWDVFVRHWETALIDWLRFQASWGFWGNTEWLEARARWILRDEGWKEALLGNARLAGAL